MPQTVNVNGKTLTYAYDASGEKQVYQNGLTETIYYAGAAEYNTTGQLSRIATGEGMIYPSMKNGTQLFQYQYYLPDHLGNTRLVFNDRGDTLQNTDYYPYGLAIRSTPIGAAGQRYLYNGKELQTETNEYDFGARFYDPSTGRWHTMDPMSQFNSPYDYTGGNPINFVDPDGMWTPGSWSWGGTIIGAVGGFAAGYFGSLALGADKDDAWKYGLGGALLGGLSLGKYANSGSRPSSMGFVKGFDDLIRGMNTEVNTKYGSAFISEHSRRTAINLEDIIKNPSKDIEDRIITVIESIKRKTPDIKETEINMPLQPPTYTGPTFPYTIKKEKKDDKKTGKGTGGNADDENLLRILDMMYCNQEVEDLV